MMRCTKRWGDPNHGFCIKPGEVCHDLAKMLVIGCFELVFDQDRRPIRRIARKDICRKIVDEDFGPCDLQRYPNRIAKMLDVFS